MLDASTIGFDLARLHCGGSVATILLDALAISPADLAALGRAEAGADPLAGLGVGASPSPHAAPPTATEALAHHRRKDDPRTAALTRLGETLRSATVTSVDALDRCVRSEVFAATWPRQDVDGPSPAVRSQAAADLEHACCEAVREAWAGIPAGAASARWEELRAHLAITPVPLGPQEELVRRVLRAVATLTTADLGGLLSAHDAVRRAGGWAAAMHDATWAVHLSGRVRAAAVAQLELARAVQEARLPAAITAAGVWNAASGAVHALVVEDLVCDGTLAVLRDPYAGVLGAG